MESDKIVTVKHNKCKGKKGLSSVSSKLGRNKMRLQTSILIKINEGTTTLQSLALSLGKRESLIKAVLDYMVHDGYIEEVTCNGLCSRCAMECPANITSIKMYTVTQKGLRYLKSTTY